MKSMLRNVILFAILGILLYTSVGVRAANPTPTAEVVALSTPENTSSNQQEEEANHAEKQRRAQLVAEYHEKTALRLVDARMKQREHVIQDRLAVRQTSRTAPQSIRFGCTAEPGADLSWCDFSGANLKGKDMSGAYIMGTNFQSANLTGAKLIGVEGVSTNFSYAVLDNANFTDAHIDSVSFYAASLKKAVVKDASFVNGDFRNANLTQASFVNTDFALANLSKTNMSGTIIRTTNDFNVDVLLRIKTGGIVGTPQLQYRYAYCGAPVLPNDDSYELCMRKFVLKNGYIIGPGVDLSYAKLAGVDLSLYNSEGWCDYQGTRGMLLNVDLSYADLRNSNLACQYLGFAEVTGTQLSGAIFEGLESEAIFGRPASIPVGVKIVRGGFCCEAGDSLFYENVFVGNGTNVVWIDFQGVDFRGANLDVYFHNNNLSHTNFSGMKLDDLQIGNSNLQQANFNNTDLGFVFIYAGTDLTGTTFQGAKVGYLIIRESNIEGVSFATLKLQGWMLLRGLIGSPIAYPPGWRMVNDHGFGKGANIYGDYDYDTEEIVSQSFDNEDFSGMDLRNAHFSNVSFRNADFEGVKFQQAELLNIDFDGADMSGISFQQAYMYNIDFDGADLRGTSFQDAEIYHTSFANAQLQGAVFSGAQFSRGVTWSNTICPDGSNSETLPGKTCLNNLSAGMQVATAKAKVVQNEAVTLTIRRMQPSASYVIRYRNGNQLASGTANSQGEATYSFSSAVVGAHEIEVVSGSESVRITQYVEVSPNNSVAVPCTIESVKSVNGFNNGIIYGDIKEVYDVVVKRGSASSVTAQVYVNNTSVASQSSNVVNNDPYISLKLDVPLNNGGALKRGHNTIKVVVSGDNNCAAAFETGQYAWPIPDFLVGGPQNEKEIGIQLAIDAALQNVLMKPGEVLKIPGNTPLTKPIDLPASIEGNKLKFDGTLKSAKWQYMGAEIKLAIKAEGELALWNPSVTQSAPDWSMGVTVNGKSEITAYEHPLLPYLADIAAPGTSQAILAALETAPPIKKWVSDRGELYVEITPELELAANANGQGFTTNELKFMFKGQIQMKAGVRSDLGIARFDANVGAGLVSENTYYPYRPTKRFESKIKVPYSAEFVLEAFTFTLKQSYKGACTWTFEAAFVLGNRQCATEGSALRRSAGWELARRPVTTQVALPRSLDDALLYPLGSSHAASSMDIAVIDDTQAVAVWEYDDTGDALGQGYDMRYSLWDGESWSAPALIANDAYLDRAPSVSYLADGSILATWERYDNSSGVGDQDTPDDLSGFMGIVWSLYSGGTWSTPAWLVKPAGTNHLMPVVVASSQGTWVFWQERTGTLLSPESAQLWYAEFDAMNQLWGDSYAYSDSYTDIDDVHVTIVNDYPALSYRATATEDVPRVYVSTLNGGTVEAPTSVDAQNVQVVPGDTPYVVWQEQDALVVQPLDAVMNMSSEGLVSQTNIFTNGLQLDEMVANQLLDGDLAVVVSGARGGQRDLSIVRYDQNTKKWGTPRTLTNNLDKESSITGRVSVDNTVFIGYRNDNVAMLPEIVSGQTITVPKVLGTSMYVMRANLQRDVGISLSEPIVVAGTTMIPMTVTNSGDTFELLDLLLVNNVPADIGDLSGYIIKPGEEVVLNVPVSAEQLAAGIEFIIGLLDGSDDNATNDRAEYAAQIAQLDVELQQILPRFDGSIDLVWQISNPSLFDVSTISNTVQINGADVFTNTIDYLEPDDSVAYVHNLPASAIADGDEVKVSVYATDPMLVTDTYTTTLTVNPIVRFMANSLQVIASKPATTVKTTLVNTGLSATSINEFTVSVYDRMSNIDRPALSSVQVPALAPGQTFTVQLPVVYSKTPCGTFVVLKDSTGNVQQLISQSVSSCADFMELRQGNSLYAWRFYDRSTMNGITSWSWKFGDGSTSTVANPAKLYTKPGLYTVELTVSNGKTKVTGSRQIQVGPSSVELTQTAAVVQTSTAIAMATAKAAITQTQGSLLQTVAAGKQQTANALATSKAGVAQTKAAAAQTVAAGKQQTANALGTSKAGVAQTKAAAAQTVAAGKQQTANALATSKAGIKQTADAIKAQTATAKAQSVRMMRTATPTSGVQRDGSIPTKTQRALDNQLSGYVPAYIEWQLSAR